MEWRRPWELSVKVLIIDDSQVMRTGIGYDCQVNEAEDGGVVLTLTLPENQKDGRLRVRMRPLAEPEQRFLMPYPFDVRVADIEQQSHDSRTETSPEMNRRV